MTIFERHPKITLIITPFLALVLLAGFLEIALRFLLPYDIGYYSATKKQGQYIYPYGAISINSAGFPDEEFNLSSSKKRIGYFGDSVTFGIGAGEGYRFSDLLQSQYPQYEHWTFSMVNDGIQDLRMLEMAEKYKLSTVVYAFNLNDILPELPHSSEAGTNTGTEVSLPMAPRIHDWLYRNLDIQWRGKSYLYTWLRTVVKNTLTRMGYGHTGFRAAELFPVENAALIAGVARRINDIGAEMKKRGIAFCVLILPYEMQISDDAARVYHELGIRWEEGFTDGSTQRLLKEDLRIPHIYDGLKAFAGLKNTAEAGEYFVYNKGDKIDFNHPNRKGHKILTDGFIQAKSCPYLT